MDCKKEELKLDSEIKVESDKVVIQVDTFDEEVKIDINNEWDIKVESEEEEIKVDSNEEELNVDSDEVANKVDTFEEEFKMDNNEWDNKVKTEKEEIKGDNNDEDLNVDSDGEEIKDSSDEEGYDNHKGIIKSHCDEELTKDETNLNNPDEYTNQSM